MKTINILIILLLVSESLFSQKIGYDITVESNYSYVSNSEISQKIPTDSPVFYGYNGLESKTVSNLFANIDYTFSGNFGFYFDASIVLPINKRLSYKTGLGLSMNNIKIQKESIVTGEVFVVVYDTINNDTLVRVYDVDEIAEFSSFVNDFNKPKIENASYNTFFLRIPMHLQISFLQINCWLQQE
jgi:hypothetical protein